jgi:hypothetical protein
MCARDNEYDRAAFKERPLLGVLLFDNVASEARDIAANERSMLLKWESHVGTDRIRSVSCLVETQHVHGNCVRCDRAIFSPEVDAVESG